jgi:hypothetical protein
MSVLGVMARLPEHERTSGPLVPTLNLRLKPVSFPRRAVYWSVMRVCLVRSLAVAVMVAACHAAEADGLSSEVAEVDGDKDGRPDVRTEVVSRDGVKQMMVMSRADESGEWKVTATSFYVGPHMAVTESDEDGDGFFEMVAIYREAPEDVNAFVRERDGAVRPAEVKMVEALRKQSALLTEFWSKPERDPEKMEAAIMEAREKLKQIAEEAEKGD